MPLPLTAFTAYFLDAPSDKIGDVVLRLGAYDFLEKQAGTSTGRISALVAPAG